MTDKEWLTTITLSTIVREAINKFFDEAYALGYKTGRIDGYNERRIEEEMKNDKQRET